MKEYKLSELSSSRIVYDKNPPKFIKYIVVIISLCMISIVVISCLTYKTEVVRISALLTSENKINVQSPNQGKIEKIYVENGQFVKKGDLLFKIDTIQIDSQIIALQSKCDYINNHIDKMNRFISELKSIDLNNLDNITNPFADDSYYLDFKNMINELLNAEGNTQDEIIASRESVIEQYLSSYFNNKSQYEYELIGNESQIKAYRDLHDSYYVYADNDGYISLTSSISDNSVVDSNVVCTISEKLTNNNAIITCYVPTENRNFIKKEMDVEISINGLLQSKYGMLTGKIVHISDDILTDENGNVYYSVKIKPNSITMPFDSNIELFNGQSCEVRIKYDSITWMSWGLKKIGIIK